MCWRPSKEGQKIWWEEEVYQGWGFMSIIFIYSIHMYVIYIYMTPIASHLFGQRHHQGAESLNVISHRSGHLQSPQDETDCPPHWKHKIYCTQVVVGWWRTWWTLSGKMTAHSDASATKRQEATSSSNDSHRLAPFWPETPPRCWKFECDFT